MLSWLRELAYESARSQCLIRCIHIAGAQNRLPDLLSRWHCSPKFGQQFREVVSNEWQEVLVKRELLNCQRIW